jgi:PDDEXK-like domain of unknown function (DUF3799)
MSAAEQLSEEHPLGLPTGIHRGITPERYHARHLGVVNKGALTAIGRSPKYYRSWLAEPDEDTPAFAFGRAFHCAILEPEIFARDYTVAPDFGDCRFKEAKAARDEWRQANAGKIELTAADGLAIERMAASLRSHELGALVLRDGEPELTIVWQDEDTGLFCKTRPDYWVRSRRMCIDLKSTEDARLASFTRDAVRFDYPLQDALYRSAFAAVGESVDHFLFVAVEKTPPFDVSVLTLDQDGVSRGYSRCRMRMDLMAECLRTDQWPGYEPRIHTMELPAWYD